MSVWAWKGRSIQFIEWILRFKISFYSNGCPCLILSVGGTEAKIFLNRMVVFPIVFPYGSEIALKPHCLFFFGMSPSSHQWRWALKRRGSPQKQRKKHDGGQQQKELTISLSVGSFICGILSNLMPQSIEQRHRHGFLNLVDSKRH